MKPGMQLWYCWRCERATYWNRMQCQRCLLVRQARIRGYLIIAACVLIFALSIMRIYWGYR